ncbi:MAG: hypothetical protein RLY61_80 [Candidatus Parcubacteria bacterium]|jgi:hypothetical protein
MSEENDNILLGIYIQLSRVYDMLVLIADGVGKGEEALEVRNLHEQGKILTPPPSLVEDEDA